MKEVLLFGISLASASCFANSNSAAALAIQFQDAVNAGKYEQALNYWEEEKRKQMAQHNSQLVPQLFSHIKLQKDSIKSQCNKSTCTVSASYQDDSGEQKDIIYTFVGKDSLKLSNVRANGS